MFSLIAKAEKHQVAERKLNSVSKMVQTARNQCRSQEKNKRSDDSNCSYDDNLFSVARYLVFSATSVPTIGTPNRQKAMPFKKALLLTIIVSY